MITSLLVGISQFAPSNISPWMLAFLSVRTVASLWWLDTVDRKVEQFPQLVKWYGRCCDRYSQIEDTILPVGKSGFQLGQSAILMMRLLFGGCFLLFFFPFFFFFFLFLLLLFSCYFAKSKTRGWLQIRQNVPVIPTRIIGHPKRKYVAFWFWAGSDSIAFILVGWLWYLCCLFLRHVVTARKNAWVLGQSGFASVFAMMVHSREKDK